MELLIMCIPVLVTVALFNYFPMFGLVIAFKDCKFDKGIFGSKWVGFENFKFFFQSQDLWNVTRNTIFLNLGIIIVSTFLSVVLALMLYEISSKLLIKTYQTILFIPYFISWVVVSYIAYAFFNESYGIINKFLETIGIQPVPWYSESGLWPAVLIFSVHGRILVMERLFITLLL
jgi:putative aldouronate transport system permease protein